jgi:transposase
MDHFVGIDLHSNNSYIAVIDTDNNRVFKKKARNNLSEILKLLALSKNRLKG